MSDDAPAEVLRRGFGPTHTSNSWRRAERCSNLIVQVTQFQANVLRRLHPPQRHRRAA